VGERWAPVGPGISPVSLGLGDGLGLGEALPVPDELGVGDADPDSDPEGLGDPEPDSESDGLGDGDDDASEDDESDGLGDAEADDEPDALSELEALDVLDAVAEPVPEPSPVGGEGGIGGDWEKMRMAMRMATAASSSMRTNAARIDVLPARSRRPGHGSGQTRVRPGA